MSLGSIIARVGGFRGLAAGAAIAWGTSQATTIAQEAQEAAAAAQEHHASMIGMIEERTKELENITRSYDTYLDNMRAEARAAVAEDIRAGRYDGLVIDRANAIAAASPLPMPPGNVVLGTDVNEPDAKV